MGNGTALREESEARKVQRFRWARWNAPLVLLLLSFTIMLMLFLSKRLESTSGNGSLAPYVFAALLCTLVASSITLIGCSSKQTERFNQSVISQANSAASKLVQTAQAHSRANEQNITKISHLVDNQQQLLDKFVELKSAVENRHEFLHKTTQGLKEELTESIAAVYSSNKTIQSRIDGLLLAGKLMSGRIGATLEKQELLCSALREHSGVLEGRMSDLAEEHQEIRRRLEVLQELIQAISGDITDVAREQASLHDKVDIRGEESVRRIEMLSEDHASLSNDLGQLGENVKQGSVETIEAVTQQMVNHESFKAHAEALNVQFSGLADAQEQLRGKVNGLREFITAVDSNVADLVHKQAKLHETVENRAEESVLHLETLSRDHKNVQNQLEKLDETVRNVSAEAVELVTRQLMSRESFEAHREALYNQLSGLVAAQEQFRGHVNDLRELLGAVAGDVTNIAREQGTLHETIGKQSEENTGQMEELVQKSLQHIEALSDDHRNLHTHLNHLGEEVKQASVEAAETVVRRVASRESFEAHTKALDAQLSGFSAAQEQLRNHIDGLRELIQGVVGDVTNVAHEQAIMHKAIEIKSEE